MTTQNPQGQIDGFCEPRFMRVREAFSGNFNHHAERGGAVAIALRGRVVVDLWGGWSDVARERRWQRDTIVNFFSVSKALCAIAALRLAERGCLDLDAPVARYWPEFSANGKDAITVRDALTHRAALPALRAPLHDAAMLEWQTIIDALARERPWWTPGTAHGYHVNTFGFLVGEIVRRVSGKTIGTFLREELALPLDADVHIGLPKSEHYRVAEFLWPGNPHKPDLADDHQLMRWNAYWNPLGFSGAGWVNDRRGARRRSHRPTDTAMRAASRAFIRHSPTAARSTASAFWIARALRRQRGNNPVAPTLSPNVSAVSASDSS